MHLGPEVAAARLVLAEIEHASQRRYAQRGDRLFPGAKEDAASHTGDCLCARRDLEAVGARCTWGLQERKNRQALRIGRRLLEPEFCEGGELLTASARGVDSQASGGQAVLLA